MTAGKCGTTRCGLCRFYSHEGRRGGLCRQLNVNVDSQWKACCLAESPFVCEPKPVMGIAKLVANSVRELPVVSLDSESVSAPAATAEPLSKRLAKPLNTKPLNTKPLNTKPLDKSAAFSTVVASA